MAERSINGFVEWIKNSFILHPIYTVCFGVACGFGGFFLGGIIVA